MATKTIDARAVCPYWRSEGIISIVCEGIITGEVMHRFDRVEDKVRHEERFCTRMDCYKNCSFAACLEEKYREGYGA